MVAMDSQEPLLIYDGDCGFCQAWAERWQRWTRRWAPLAIEPSQSAAPRFPEIPAGRWREAVALVQPDGRVQWAAEAVFQSLARVPGLAWLLWLYQDWPAVAWLTEAVYAWVARHRKFLSSGACRLENADLRGTYFLSRWLFLRGLALVFGLAFWSLDRQLDGLIGSHGILPAADFLAQVRQQFGATPWTLLPSLAWFNPSDAGLHWLCRGGLALAVLGLLGVGSKPVYLGLWACYLSLVGVGQDFLQFQWDSLLLEAGLLAVLVAPWTWWDRPDRPMAPLPLQVWLYRWLLFRLMLRSGLVKLASGDPSWRHLNALRYHYQTQPLPTWLGWYAHQLPAWFQSGSVLAMFVVELALPFGIFLGRRARLIALGGFVALQGLIALTGNYGFFNLLTLLLGLWLLDDACYPRAWGRVLLPGRRLRPRPPGLRPVLAAWAVVALLLGGWQLLQAVDEAPASSTLQAWDRALEPWRAVNPYGLFAVITTERDEVVLEGSADGKNWKEYGFYWKPGAVGARPAFVAPHLPRLDWQLWFAALGGWRDNPWLLNLMARLLQGEPSVLGLLKDNPFPDKPPRVVRALRYRYRFSSWAERRQDGSWWKREPLGVYCGPLSLR
jgi:predicted DCC family thiol-disulfide oxidoreductase YuxK